MGVPPRYLLFALAISLVWPLPAAAQPEHEIDPLVVSIDTPGSNTVGLVWGGDRIWASDREKNEVSYYEDGGWVAYPEWDGEPGPLAWDGTGLWVVDEAGKQIVRIDVQSDPPARTTIPIPFTALRDPPAITGLAWIDGDLWLATGCGLCSTIYRLDAGSGEILQSFFPKCVPRGLAFYQGGLWTVAFGGPRKDSLMSRREVTDDPGTVSSPQDFYVFGPATDPPAPGPPIDPTAIAIVNGAFWVVDRNTDQISRYDPRSVP